MTFFNSPALAYLIFFKKGTEYTLIKIFEFCCYVVFKVFHNVILEYCSKRIGYKNDAFVTRTQLAYLDYNSHLNRPQLERKDGTLPFGRRFGKRTKMWYATPVPVAKSYSYVPGISDAFISNRSNI